MAESSEGPTWQALIRSAVRECLEAWMLQAQAGPVAPEALEGILARSSVLLMRRLEGVSPDVVVTLLPIMIRSMLGAFVEAMEDLLEGRT